MKKTIIYLCLIINSILFINAIFGTSKVSKFLFLGVFIITIIPILIYFIKIKQKKLDSNQQINNMETTVYHSKEMLTECEKQFLSRLNNIFKDKYIIQPQIPLRMIVSKDGEEQGIHAGELNRYIDFGIFNNNYKLLALIELNDKSHKTKKRFERDLKVQDICKQANIPLITFWTYGNQTNENIRYIIEKEINNETKTN